MAEPLPHGTPNSKSKSPKPISPAVIPPKERSRTPPLASKKSIETPPRNLKKVLTDDEELKKRKRIGTLRQWLASLVITISTFIMGTSVGWASPTLYYMKTAGVPFNMTTSEVSVMVSCFYIGNILMPVPGGILSDKIGRKASLLVMSVVPFLSWVFVYVATSPMMLHIARILAGLWSGHILTVVPFYLGEIVEPRVRGRMTTTLAMLTNLGIIAAYAMGTSLSYHTTAIILGSLPVFYFIILFWVPESPYWLIFNGEDTAAEKSLMWLRGFKNSEHVEIELFHLTEDIYADTNKTTSLKSLCRIKGTRVALIIVIILSVSQRFVGISALMAYAGTSLPDKKIWVLSPNHCVTVIGISWIIGLVMAFFLIDFAGRRILIVISCAGIAAAMLTSSVWYALNRDCDNQVAHYVPFVSFFVYGIFYNVGLGPVPSIVQGEMFPPQFKAVASAITAISMAFASAAVNFAYPHVSETLGIHFNFIFYLISSLACLLFTIFYVVETKSQTLHNIQSLLDRSSVRGFVRVQRKPR